MAISALIQLGQATSVSPDTRAISAMLHALAGAVLLDKDVDMVGHIMPWVEAMKEEAKKELAILEEQKKENDIFDQMANTEFLN